MELYFMAARTTHPSHGLGHDTCLWGPRPLLLVGKQAAGTRVASSPDSDLEASKGSLGHAFTVRIRTGNQNQTSFYPSVPHEISVLVELILGHLRYLLTDVPPQPNSPPDNVFRPDRPAEAGLGSKKRGIAPLPIHGIIGFPLSVPVLSWLFDAREGPRRSRSSPSPGPARGDPLSPRKQLEQSADSRRVGTGDPRAQPSEPILFPRLRIHFADFPCLHCSSTRGCSPWRPDAVMSTTGRGRHSVLRIFKGRRGRTGHRATCGALSSRWTLPPTESFPRVGRLLNRKDNSSRGPPPTSPGLPNVADRLTHVQVPFNGTFPLFGLQSSHLNICYYHQDPHRRPLRPGSRPRFCSDRRALLLIGAWHLPRRPGVGRALKRHPFSGLVDFGRLAAQFGTVTRLPGSSRHRQFCLPKMAHLELSIPWHGSTKQPRRPTYLKTRTPGSSYPEGNFGGNQLQDGSISLSPLYPSQTNDLHVSIAAGLHQSFLWLRPAQA
ncbi:hypothetical protein L1887_62185 [Cichorium endivia]|nr:hypothetical protein L1887_62185 [Cichorium endivia]